MDVNAGDRPDLSVVIPCYRSAASLPALVDRLLPVLQQNAREFEVLLVVDGSPDETWHTAESLAHKHAGVTAFRLSRNYGQHNALLAGVRAARHPIVVTMDDDLQHRPEDLPVLLDALDPDVDLVYATPAAEKHAWWRNIASRTAKAAMSSVLKIPNADSISAFRAFRTRLRDGFVNMDGPHVSLDVALSWTASRVASVTVTLDQRRDGRSGYTFRKLVLHTANMLLGYSTAPLRAVSYLGLLIAVLGVAMFAYVMWAYTTGTTTVPGFTSTASMIAIFSGAQMLAVGILGEYLARVHLRSMGKPAYVVVDSAEHDDASTG